MNEKEVWKDVVGYEGLYAISNTGKVKSNHSSKELILRGSINRGGYRKVCLSKHSKVKTFEVHRLVAEAFLGNLHFGMQTNHIDCDKKNNSARNLEYVTAKGNIAHAIANGINGGKPKRQVVRSDGAKFDSLISAAIALNTSRSSIWLSLQKEGRTCRGYSFSYMKP